jgi:hypothetical protein
MESAVTILLNYEENAKWLSNNYERLKKSYADEWVAALDGKIIDHDHDLAKLVKRLKQQHGKVYSQIASEYVTTKELTSIF